MKELEKFPGGSPFFLPGGRSFDHSFCPGGGESAHPISGGLPGDGQAWN